jgi:2-aminobenzoate-CoA ligase
MELSPSSYIDTFARDHLPPTEQWPVLEFTTEQLVYPDRLNAAAEIIDRSVETFGADRVAILTPDGARWTYGELRVRSNQVAQVLVDDLGLIPGNRVLLRSPNNPWAVAAWLGVLKAGGIVVTTFAAFRARELQPIVGKTQPTLALVDHRFLDAIVELNTEQSPLPFLSFGGFEEDDLLARAATKSGEFTAVATAADDVALFCPTSGTTGASKITTHFHRDVMSIDNTFGKHVLRLEPDDRVACTAPFAFTFGLGMLVIFPLLAGACAVLTESATPIQLAQIVNDMGVTVLATAPTAYKQILAADSASLLQRLRAAVSAGEHLAQETWNRMHEQLGLKVIDGIGGTEMLHIFISAAGADIRPGATGKPVPGYRAAILGLDGVELPPNVAGRLAVIGPVGCRYLDDDRQRDYVVNGWNMTGDTFVRDEDGYFYYQARTDSMIVSSGYNIGGPEVEAAIDSHPDVVESAVVAEPDEVRGAIVSAFIVLKAGAIGDETKMREIQDHVKNTIAPYKYPRRVRFTNTLPRNTSGKLQHFQLRQLLEAGIGTGEAAAGPTQDATSTDVQGRPA